MPDSVFNYVVSCPASTPATAPVEVPFTGMDPIIIRKCTITIPAGHSGLTGIAIAFGHNNVLPSNTGAFISGDDDLLPFVMDGYPAGVSWSALVCNLDLQPHVWQVTIEGDVLKDPGANASPPPPTTEAIMAAATAALGGP